MGTTANTATTANAAILLISIGATVASASAMAQTPSGSPGQVFPAKSIRIVVPATPGGGTDILSRLLSPKLTENLGQSMIVENRAGASTNIGTEFVARAPPDG